MRSGAFNQSTDEIEHPELLIDSRFAAMCDSHFKTTAAIFRSSESHEMREKKLSL